MLYVWLRVWMERCVCCGLDFELVFSCECVGREEMLTGCSKVLTLKETVPEIRHGSIETSTYSGKRRKHTLIYAFKEIVLLKENNGYYFPLYLSYSIYFCLSLSHRHKITQSFWTFTHFPGLYITILNSHTQWVCHCLRCSVFFWVIFPWMIRDSGLRKCTVSFISHTSMHCEMSVFVLLPNFCLWVCAVTVRPTLRTNIDYLEACLARLWEELLWFIPENPGLFLYFSFDAFRLLYLNVRERFRIIKFNYLFGRLYTVYHMICKN